MADNHLWWQSGVVYQIYPRSFQDSDGDGIGDLQGIIRRLDHLRWLGVQAVWISPIFPSPMADFGYDVADYTGIHPLFGSMDDFDRLVEEAHGRGLKVILDFVPNHSSDQHPWFLESRSSRDNPKRDWYIWKDPAPGGEPPNNWLSVFGGPGWEWDETTQQFYYHAFLTQQPDLNWRNPEVQEAMLDAMRFWYENGVDGFRVDVIWHIIKDDRFRDNPPNPDWEEGQMPYDSLQPVYSTDQPEVHEIAARMRQVADEFGERVIIGEIYLPIGKMMAYYGQDGEGVHLPFNFQLIELPWDATKIYAAIAEYEGSLPEGGWPNWVLGNHDKSRIASRVGAAQARVAAMLLLTLRGTPTIYYGDEIGMTDVALAPDEVQDPQGKNLGLSFTRDPQRTPMQWDDSENAGFTTGEPWLPVSDDFQEVNVAAQRDDSGSMLSLYRRLLELRNAESALSAGDYIPGCVEDEIITYLREADGTRFLVALNLGGKPGVVTVPRLEVRGTVEVGTRRNREGERIEGSIELRGDEGIVVRLDG
jgi:alpha-glucosidase